MYTVLLAEDEPDLTASVMQEKRMHDDSDDLSFPAAHVHQRHHERRCEGLISTLSLTEGAFA